MFADFAGVCFDQIANQMAKYRYMTGGQVRAGDGPDGQRRRRRLRRPAFAVRRELVHELPGLKIAVPATPGVLRLLRAAIADPIPCLVRAQGPAQHEGRTARPRRRFTLGPAAIVRAGTNITVVATQLMLHHSLAAADLLEREGISIEVIDPRTLVPLDLEPLSASVERTHRLVCMQESQSFGSWAAQRWFPGRFWLSTFEDLDAPPRIVDGAADSQIPYAGVLEDAWLPTSKGDRCRRARDRWRSNSCPH